MPSLTHVAVHPIKALDPLARDRAPVTAIGGLADDRAYAFVDESGAYVNGKRTDDVHRVQADFDPDGERVTVRARGEQTDREFHLEEDREALEAWASEYFGVDVRLEATRGGGLTDGVVYGDESKTGPTVIAEETLAAVASWYEGISPEEMRLRLRPNLVVAGVPAFWEDKLVAGDGRRLRIGDVILEGTRPISRCIVPARDPHTGEEYERFRETFVERRRETLPPWTDEERTLEGNPYSVMVGTRIPESQREGVLHVGDHVSLESPRSDE